MPRPRFYTSNAERQAAYRARERTKTQTLRARVQRYRPQGTSEWTTPPALFAQLHKEFHFTLDVAAQPANALCARFYTPEQDGLAQSWAGEVCWCNPPYAGTGVLARWVRKAVESAQAGATVVCLLPASTDTQWWHAWVIPYGEIRFVQGRLKFSGSKTNARFSSAIVIFRPPPRARGRVGACQPAGSDGHRRRPSASHPRVMALPADTGAGPLGPRLARTEWPQEGTEAPCRGRVAVGETPARGEAGAARTSNYRSPSLLFPKKPDGGEKDHPQDTSTNTGDAQLRFLPGASPAHGGNQPTSATHDAMTSALSISADGQTSGRRESACSNTNKDVLEHAGGISAAEQIFSQEVSIAPASNNGCGGVSHHPPVTWREDI
jgi:phage N-6-adenine-methyltransferase